MRLMRTSLKLPETKTTAQRLEEFTQLLARARAKRIEAQALIRQELLSREKPTKRAA